MLTETDAKVRGLADLPEVESDSLLQLIALCNADPRPEKIDVGVGVFRDGKGRTPILPVIKDAERILLETQESKSYLGSAGDKRFTELLRPILLGDLADNDNIAGAWVDNDAVTATDDDHPNGISWNRLDAVRVAQERQHEGVTIHDAAER